jgi:hypothetical protein
MICSRIEHVEDMMARRDQFLDDGQADEAGGASDKHAHERNLQASLETNAGSRGILVKY